MNAKLKEMLEPGIRLFIICAAAALVLGFVNEFTRGKIAESRAEEDRKALARMVGPGESIGERYTAFPVRIKKQDFETRILSLCDPAAQALFSRTYRPDGDEHLSLLPGLDAVTKIELSKVLQRIKFEATDTVRAWYSLQKGDEIFGYILELSGTGFGGALKLFAAFGPDGTVKNAVLVDNKESPAQRKKAEQDDYMEKFIGTRGMAVPAIKSMLKVPDTDAVSGASITFMGISGALRGGSLWIMAMEAQ